MVVNFHHGVKLVFKCFLLLFAVLHFLVCCPCWVLDKTPRVVSIFGMGPVKGFVLHVHGDAVYNSGMADFSKWASGFLFVNIKFLLKFLGVSKVRLPVDPTQCIKQKFCNDIRGQKLPIFVLAIIWWSCDTRCFVVYQFLWFVVIITVVIFPHFVSILTFICENS